ncbi:unnamed protein product [Caenorhabditis angaria]|uniref:C-type lectin domain-containing protein n=1 Tax=Caenorhabditis angaria TaxID=860376 RepID=A0A9P1IL34_9PELO|nr:unnamed protein product [Caenorhabditis angaria]
MKNQVEMCIPTQQIEYSPSTSILTTTTTSTSSTTTTSTTTTTPPPPCPDSTWTLFDRGNYSWCMKVYFGTVYVDSADASCASLDSSAVLSGFQNVSEISKMMNVALSEYPTIIWLMVGAKRREACEAVVGVTSTCTAQNSFYWTDGYTYGSEGFNWWNGIPTNPEIAYGRYYMYCVVNANNDFLSTTEDDKTGFYLGAVCGMLAKV